MTVFQPNLTTDLLVKGAREIIARSPVNVTTYLELGCGSGHITAQIADELSSFQSVLLTDVSSDAIQQAQLNLEGLSLPGLSFAVSDCFDAVQGSFDLIICDIAAISSGVNKFFDWYDGVQCNSGSSGTDLICRTITEIHEYMNEGGFFIFPIISLSNKAKTLGEAQKAFQKLEQISTKRWPLPQLDELAKTEFLEVVEDNCLMVQQSSGMLVATTEVWCGYY